MSIAMVDKKKTAIKEKQTQSQVVSFLAEETGLTKKQVVALFEAFGDLVHRHIAKNGSGEIKIPYLGVKIHRKTKPATKKRNGINPATGERIVIAAKPKREVVKVTPLKALKSILDK